jgi:hypothetical protein
VDDGHVGVECRYRGQGLPRERADDRSHAVRSGGETGSRIATEHRERESGGTGHISIGQAGVAVFIDLESAGPGILDRVAEAMEGADAGIPAPGEDQLGGTTHPDHLVEEQIRGEPDEREIGHTLADDFVAGGKRYEVGESLHGDGIAVMDQQLDGLRQCQYLCHGSPVCAVRTIDLMSNV